MRTFTRLNATVAGLFVALFISQTAIAQEQPAQSNDAAATESQAAQGQIAQNQLSQSDRQYQMEHKFEKAEQYFLEFNEGATSEDFEKLRPWLKPFTDVEIMMDMFSDPRKMVQWMNAISEPEAVYLMMKCSTEPVMWDTWMAGLTDVPKMTNAMFRFMDPNMYFNWMTGMMDPQVYMSMLALMDPNKYIRWAAKSVLIQNFMSRCLPLPTLTGIHATIGMDV